VVLIAVHLIGQRVVGDIDHHKKVGAAHGLIDDALALTGAETRAVDGEEIGIGVIAAVVQGAAALIGRFRARSAHPHEVSVDFFREIAAALERCDFQRRNGKTIVFGGLIGHLSSFSF
jgi:hypothetical protein